MVDMIHAAAVVFAIGLAPPIYVISRFYRRQFKQVDFEWKRSEISLITILAFVLNITLFIAACFLFLGYMGRAKFDLIDLQPHQLKTLCIDAMLVFGGVTLLYLSIQNLYVQYICREGIAFTRWAGRRPFPQVEILKWEEIKDYYMRSDYPVTHFHFLISGPDFTFTRKSLKVPFYALAPFETLLELNLKRRREERLRSREVSDRYSKDLFLEED